MEIIGSIPTLLTGVVEGVVGVFSTVFGALGELVGSLAPEVPVDPDA